MKNPEKLFKSKYTRLSPHDFDKFGGALADKISKIDLDGDTDILVTRSKGKLTFKSF